MDVSVIGIGLVFIIGLVFVLLLAVPALIVGIILACRKGRRTAPRSES